MSAVVILELLAGAHTVRDRTRLHDLFRTFRKLERVLTPSAETYEDAGGVLRQLQAHHGYQLRQRYSLVNDVLIALSARSVGGTVVTQNRRDFLAIQAIRPFKLREGLIYSLLLMCYEQRSTEREAPPCSRPLQKRALSRIASPPAVSGSSMR